MPEEEHRQCAVLAFCFDAYVPSVVPAGRTEPGYPDLGARGWREPFVDQRVQGARTRVHDRLRLLSAAVLKTHDAFEVAGKKCGRRSSRRSQGNVTSLFP